MDNALFRSFFFKKKKKELNLKQLRVIKINDSWRPNFQNWMSKLAQFLYLDVEPVFLMMFVAYSSFQLEISKASGGLGLLTLHKQIWMASLYYICIGFPYKQFSACRSYICSIRNNHNAFLWWGTQQIRDRVYNEFYIVTCNWVYSTVIPCSKTGEHHMNIVGRDFKEKNKSSAI